MTISKLKSKGFKTIIRDLCQTDLDKKILEFGLPSLPDMGAII
jgi:hypothetical protein